ncbi:hypothetical protein GCM10022234_20880 [Aeromicrobium panaciterrae]|uniref:DUF2283 domain-containing protein n=1 Tax=Aeromicrobium panaciterrae TaxID=363861 RepID=UPI0031D979C6
MSEKQVPLKITFDPDVNAAYIYLVDEIGFGEAAKTYSCDPLEVGGMINLDFDSNGRLLGIEVLDATGYLDSSLLA